MLAASTSASTVVTPAWRGALPHACAFAAGLALTLLAAASAEAQWVVSAAGDGDFTNLQEAIDHASPGEVLYVMPGNYGTAVLEKQLSILGAATGTKPRIQALDIQGAPSFQLQNLHFDVLRAVGVPGRSVIDACAITTKQGWLPVGFFSYKYKSSNVLEDSADVLVQNSTSVGAVDWLMKGTAGLYVLGASRVQVVNSELRGGSYNWPNPNPFEPCFTEPYFGGHGLVVAGTSRVWVAASQVRGGTEYACWPSSPAYRGHGIVAEDEAVVHVRGNASHLVLGGGEGFPASLVAISGSGNAQVTWSGVTLYGVASFAQADPDLAPFLRTAGGQLPGQTVTVLFYGEAGAPALLLVGLEPAQLDVPGLLGAPLWLAPGSLLTILSTQLTGLNDPVRFPFLLPPIPQLAGLAVYAQGVQPKPNGEWLATNLSATLLTY